MNNTVIVLNGPAHLTTTSGINDLTEATFDEYHFRKAIEDLTKAIPKTLDENGATKFERLYFCTKDLPLMLTQCVKEKHRLLQTRIAKVHSRIQSTINNLNNLRQLASQLYSTMKRTKRHNTTLKADEAQSIAEKIFQEKCDIPFEMPRLTANTRDITSKCCVCHVGNMRTQKRRCSHCASVFHNNCNRNQTKCPTCLAGNTPIDIVLKATASQKWWPALVIHDHQVPEDIYQQRNEAPGYVFVYVFGKHTYEQVHARHLLSFRFDDEYRKMLLEKNDDATVEIAIKVAKELR